MNRVGALVLLIFLLPVFAIVSILIRLTSDGPVIFTQSRVGIGNKLFTIYKFRTMKWDELNHSLELTKENDQRITILGKFLRKYRIDELPQLINIIKNDMGWIGHRPEQKYYMDKLVLRSPSFASLYKKKPGIISLGIIKFGYAGNIDEIAERAKYDKYYLQHPSFKLNVYIMKESVKIILSGKGR